MKKRPYSSLGVLAGPFQVFKCRSPKGWTPKCRKLPRKDQGTSKPLKRPASLDEGGGADGACTKSGAMPGDEHGTGNSTDTHYNKKQP